MSERERNLERSNTLFKAVLNVNIERMFKEWQDYPANSCSYWHRLGLLLKVAQDSGFGLSIQAVDRGVIGGKKLEISQEVIQYREFGTKETVIINLPTKEERRKLHKRKLQSQIFFDSLQIWKSGRVDTEFPKKDIVSLKVR